MMLQGTVVARPKRDVHPSDDRIVKPSRIWYSAGTKQSVVNLYSADGDDDGDDVVADHNNVFEVNVEVPLNGLDFQLHMAYNKYVPGADMGTPHTSHTGTIRYDAVVALAAPKSRAFRISETVEVRLTFHEHSSLEELRENLKYLHYRKLQALCIDPREPFDYLPLTRDEWRSCYSTRNGCKGKMVAAIVRLVAKHQAVDFVPQDRSETLKAQHKVLHELNKHDAVTLQDICMRPRREYDALGFSEAQWKWCWSNRKGYEKDTILNSVREVLTLSKRDVPAAAADDAPTLLTTLRTMHYRGLQSQCWHPRERFDPLGLSAAEWRQCWRDGVGCRDAMFGAIIKCCVEKWERVGNQRTLLGA